MKAVKRFVNASAGAVQEILAHVDEGTKAKIGHAFTAGNRLSISYIVDPTGESAVTLSVIYLDGTQRVIATCNGKNPTIQ